MANSKTEKFSTRVKVEGGGAHGDTHFTKVTHHDISGRAPYRTSVFRYKGDWWNGQENPTKEGSFTQGGKAKAPEGMDAPKQATAKKAAAKKPAAKKTTAKKPAAKKRAAKGKAAKESDRKVIAA